MLQADSATNRAPRFRSAISEAVSSPSSSGSAEETGVSSVDLLGRTEGWITYDFPPEVLANERRSRGWLGQKQVWFAYRFIGDEAEIDLEADEHVEFDAWKWGRLDEAPELIVPFKRQVYEAVVAEFGHLAGR